MSEKLSPKPLVANAVGTAISRSGSIVTGVMALSGALFLYTLHMDAETFGYPAVVANDMREALQAGLEMRDPEAFARTVLTPMFLFLFSKSAIDNGIGPKDKLWFK